jgi:hypothetical protein
MVSNIDKEDVISVADSLHITLTEEQVNKVLLMYNDEEEKDVTATWVEITENCIYQVV